MKVTDAEFIVSNEVPKGEVWAVARPTVIELVSPEGHLLGFVVLKKGQTVKVKCGDNNRKRSRAPRAS